jgi:hypothetical protein
MNFNKILLGSTLLISTVAIAMAQPAAPAGGGGGGRGGAIRAACGADITTNCAGKQGPEIRQCLTDNQAKLSDGCKAAMAQMTQGGGGAAP